MKFIKSKLLQKAKGRKKGKYLITLEVTDYDIEMFEDFTMTYAPYEILEEPSAKNDFNGAYSADYKIKYRRWIDNVWRQFLKLWKVYDD